MGALLEASGLARLWVSLCVWVASLVCYVNDAVVVLMMSGWCCLQR